LGMIRRWFRRAKNLKTELHILYLAYRDPRVPRHAKLLAALVVAYAFSPVDLIPDFIPVLGYLDDLVLVPLGISLAMRMIPAEILDDYRIQARRRLETTRAGLTGAGLIIVLWLIVLVIVIYFLSNIIFK